MSNQKYIQPDWNVDYTLQGAAYDVLAIVGYGPYPAGNIVIGNQGPYAIQSFMSLTCQADETANVFTITFVDANYNTVTTSFNGGNAASVVIPHVMRQVLSMSCSQNTTGYISLVNANETATPWFKLDQNRTFFSVGVGVGVSKGAVLNYSIEYTFDYQPQAEGKANAPAYIIPDADLVGAMASGGTYYDAPVDYIRLRFNSWTSGTAKLSIRQSDSRNAGQI